MTLTYESLQSVLRERFEGVLVSGCHENSCAACVRELRAAALDLPWSDHPDGEMASPTDLVCQRLNDAGWSSNEARTRYCLPLALLSEATAANGWRDAYILQTIRVSVSEAFRAAASVHPIQEHKDALNAHAETLSQVARSAAESAARSAESAAWTPQRRRASGTTLAESFNRDATRSCGYSSRPSSAPAADTRS